MHADPETRITIEQAAQHPWVKVWHSNTNTHKAIKHTEHNNTNTNTNTKTRHTTYNYNHNHNHTHTTMPYTATSSIEEKRLKDSQVMAIAMEMKAGSYEGREYWFICQHVM